MILRMHCANRSAANWNKNDTEMREEMIPMVASDIPISVSSFARNTSATKTEVQYSKDACKI